MLIIQIRNLSVQDRRVNKQKSSTATHLLLSDITTLSRCT